MMGATEDGGWILEEPEVIDGEYPPKNREKEEAT